MSVWGPILAALLGGGLVQIIVSLANRKKTDAESTNLIAEAAEHIIGRLENEVKTLRDQLQDMAETQAKQNEASLLEISKLRKEIIVLRKEIHRLGGDPDQIPYEGV